jgi:hypothetical protein
MPLLKPAFALLLCATFWLPLSVSAQDDLSPEEPAAGQSAIERLMLKPETYAVDDDARQRTSAAEVAQCTRTIQLRGNYGLAGKIPLKASDLQSLKALWCTIAQGHPEITQFIHISDEFNAAVIDGAYVEVGRGLLAAYRRDMQDLLAFTLAHELGVIAKGKTKKVALLGLAIASYCTAFHDYAGDELRADMFALERLSQLGFNTIVIYHKVIDFMMEHNIDVDPPKCLNLKGIVQAAKRDTTNDPVGKPHPLSPMAASSSERNPHPSIEQRDYAMRAWHEKRYPNPVVMR